MNKTLVYGFILLFTCLLSGCSDRSVNGRIQTYLRSNYRNYHLTVIETAKLPYNNYRFWATDKKGITIQGLWYSSDKRTNDIHMLYEEASRRHAIVTHIKTELSGDIYADIYTGETEHDIIIYCMEILTTQNKQQIMDKLRLVLNQTAALFNLSRYQASVRFTWQGTSPEAKPLPYESPNSYYNTYLFAVLTNSDTEEDVYFHLAGKYVYTTLKEKLTQKAIEIDNTVYSAPIFFQINQQSFSEIFTSFQVRPEKPGASSQLFLVYNLATDTVNEYHTVTVLLPDSEDPDGKSSFAEYIPSRFRCKENQLKHPGLFYEIY